MLASLSSSKQASFVEPIRISGKVSRSAGVRRAPRTASRGRGWDFAARESFRLF
jgi:hypothetical protein